jgi:hypothetical protein
MHQAEEGTAIEGTACEIVTADDTCAACKRAAAGKSIVAFLAHAQTHMLKIQHVLHKHMYTVYIQTITHVDTCVL